MKKQYKYLILVLIVLGFFAFERVRKIQRIKEIKKGWYGEVLVNELRMRNDTTPASLQVGSLKKGEVVKILDMKIHKNKETSAGGYNYIWYLVQKDKKGSKWIGNPKKGDQYIKIVNNPHDMEVPTIKYKEAVYKTDSVDTITFDHLILKDDKTPKDKLKITYVLYHEKVKGKKVGSFWIEYKVTDEAGKSSSKVQKIEFKENPDINSVKDFSELER